MGPLFPGDKHKKGHRCDGNRYGTITIHTSFRTHNWLVVMVIGTVHYHTYQFSARNGPNGEAQFFATAFLDQNLSNRKNNQTNTNQMMGWIENRPNKFFNQKNFRQMLPPKQRCYVLGLPVLIMLKDVS
jgi:hypothetical protein